MRKYWLLLSQRFSEYLSYRVNILFTVFQRFISPMLLLVILSQAQSSQVSLDTLVPYYILVSLVLPLTRSRVDTEIEATTTSGDINNFLSKPVSLYKFLFFRDLGGNLVHLAVVSPLIIVVLAAFIKSPLLSLTPFSLAMFMLTLCLSVLISFNYSYLVGLLCFWLDEFWAIHNLKSVLFHLLGGAVLPYTFFPDSFISLLKYSPFPYMLNWPVRVLQGEFNLPELITSLVWLILFYFAIRLVQKTAISKYSHTGN